MIRCAVDGCDDQARVKAMCTACYYRLYRTGTVEFAYTQPHRYRYTRKPGRPRTDKLCSLPGCKRRHYAKELCQPHWKQARRMQASPVLSGPELKRVPIHPLLPHLKECVERHGDVHAAELFGVTHGHIHHLLTRNKSVDVDVADRICIALGLPFDALFNQEAS